MSVMMSWFAQYQEFIGQNDLLPETCFCKKDMYRRCSASSLSFLKEMKRRSDHRSNTSAPLLWHVQSALMEIPDYSQVDLDRSDTHEVVERPPYTRPSFSITPENPVSHLR